MKHSSISSAQQASVQAVIEIGATGIRMIVVEVSADGQWSVVDRAERALALGRDVFTVTAKFSTAGQFPTIRSP